MNIEVFSTGGTKNLLNQHGLAIKSISEITGFPEILDGRVKTLHPAIHSGILARREIPEHDTQMKELGFNYIDIVIVNLYPFVETVSKENVSITDALENIDIGGPTLIRASAKNYPNVIILVDPADYEPIINQIAAGNVPIETRRKLAAKAFQHTAYYDTFIANYLREENDIFPDKMTLALNKELDLEYGENPNQIAAIYSNALLIDKHSSLTNAIKIFGPSHSFNNTLDLDISLRCIREFASTTVCIVKQGLPIGLACGQELKETYNRAINSDPGSTVGAVLGVNKVVDKDTAILMSQTFYEDIIAPDYCQEALDILSKNNQTRIFKISVDKSAKEFCIGKSNVLDIKSISGGFMIQTLDTTKLEKPNLKVVTEREPTLEELTNLIFAWRAVKYIKSSGIVLAKRLAIVGVGAAQPSRMTSLQLAINKAGDRSIGIVLSSDGFLSRPELVEIASLGGISAIIQPGGSIRDEEIIRIANKHHIAMINTGIRALSH